MLSPKRSNPVTCGREAHTFKKETHIQFIVMLQWFRKEWLDKHPAKHTVKTFLAKNKYIILFMLHNQSIRNSDGASCSVIEGTTLLKTFPPAVSHTKLLRSKRQDSKCSNSKK